MWFKRKPGNRRLARKHVLEVKLRSSQVRVARTRMAIIALAVVFALVFGIYLCWRAGGWALNRFLYENQAFAIEEIQVETDGVIAVDQLRRWAGVRLGDNLLALDLTCVKRDLEMVTTIQSASVERILPRKLRLRVTEREPLAQVNLPRPRAGGGVELAVFHLDVEGHVMLPLDPRQRATPPNPGEEQFPIISGVSPSQVQAGRRIDLPQVQAAVRLIEVFEQSPLAGLTELKRIDVSSPEVLVVTTTQGSEVTFALADLEQQLRRWREVFDLGQRMNKAIATLDLAVPNNIPARWLEAAAAPPVPPKAPRTSRNRKKNV